MHEANTNLSKLVAAVEGGDVDEIELARAGKVVARFVAARAPSDRRPGAWAGRVTIHDDFDELPDDITAAFSGDAE